MKLRNKKTGEIGYLIVGRGSDHYVVTNNDWTSCGRYKSIAELNEEWEDYEEPKSFFEIEWCGNVCKTDVEDYEPFILGAKQIGNYFETKEEAEKAVEKLKAWKRLKDKGFRFSDFVYTELCDYARVNIKATMINDSINDDLKLLFGGEE